MVFVKHNSLKSDIFSNPIFIPGFSRSRFFRVQVFQSPGFPGSWFFRAQVFQGPGFSGFRFFRVRVQGLGPGFRSSHLRHRKNVYVLYIVPNMFEVNNKEIRTRHLVFIIFQPEVYWKACVIFMRMVLAWCSGMIL